MPLIRRIALWACFFTLIYLGSTKLVGCKSETSKALDVADDITEVAEESVKDVEENVKELSDKFFEDDDEIIYTNEDEDDDSELANDLFREEPTQVVKPTPAKKKVSAPTQVRSTATGRYLVVAGNYLVESNAREMVKKLQNMGFSDAEHMVFDQSQYYTVLASRSNSRSAAQSSSDNLKGKGIDNYVHTQRD